MTDHLQIGGAAAVKEQDRGDESLPRPGHRWTVAAQSTRVESNAGHI